ncbi:MAG: 3-oxoacyl-ACP synthase, partial [Nonomuraea sp.]|nr:3-oxoacyl-ACP synthase [Nonomuraea sp.]
MSFGIVAFGHTLGEWVPVAGDAGGTTRGWGYRAFHRAAPDVGLTDLAVGAGRAALERAG